MARRRARGRKRREGRRRRAVAHIDLCGAYALVVGHVARLPLAAVELAVEGRRVDGGDLRLQGRAVGLAYVQTHHVRATGPLLRDGGVQVGNLREQRGRKHGVEQLVGLRR